MTTWSTRRHRASASRARLAPLALSIALGLPVMQVLHAADDSADLVARGKYLAVAGDCVTCHTRAGGAPFTGGLAIQTPFGAIFSPNLTPDPDTGLGHWTKDQFYRALHQGVDDEGSRLYPAMPYPYFTGVTRADSDAIKSYLDSLPPVHYAAPENSLRFPFNHRVVVRVWNLLFFRPGERLGVPSTDPRLERGRYLVETLGHCGACHTPMNDLGAAQNSAHLGGGELDKWVAYNLTDDPRSGLRNWSEPQIVEYLHTGRNAHALATGPMSDVIENSTSNLMLSDLQSIAAYLKSLPPGNHDGPAGPTSAAVSRAGQAIFVDECSACHRQDGTALARAFAPLKGSAGVQAKLPGSVIRVILEGAPAATTDTATTPFTMPPFAWKLSDQEVADVATYIRNAWGNSAPAADAESVSRIRAAITHH